MRFNVNIRDGPARIGELLINDKKIVTPNILFLDTKRFKAPNYADIILTNKKSQKNKATVRVSNQFIYPKDIPKELRLSAINKIEKKELYIVTGNKDIIDKALEDNPASLFVISNAFQLFQQQSKFVDFLVELRKKIGSQKMIYLPCVGDPASFALLAYIGIDFFDSTAAIHAARNKVLLFPTDRYKTDETVEVPCSCPSCKKLHGKPSEMSFKQILDHNYYELINEVKQVRNAIVSGCLRELVETRVRTYPILTAILRNLDFNHYSFLEERTPLIRSSRLIATSKESLYRPEVKRFQERVIERYIKPRGTKILLLLPCSAKKPYSFSKSHKLFREKLFCSGNPYVVHEVVITSPLGVVPRELELTYPSSLYDIPVTGFWEEDEKKMIRELLTKYLRINKYDSVIMHLSDAIKEFIEDIVKSSVNTCVDNKPTSKESLEKLLNVLSKTTDSYDRIKPSIRVRENVESFTSYQFGKKNAEKLLKECHIKGRYPNHKIMYNNRQLGMITQQRGLISLTLDGAKRIVDSKDYWVEIYDDFKLKGSVFAPGVKDADTSIRIGDEVIVLKNNKLCAVGVAQMNGNEMKESLHGEAVKIRHRK